MASPRTLARFQRQPTQGSRSTEAIANFYVGAPCTLDGKPAYIKKFNSQFGIVAYSREEGMGFRWPWFTIARIMEQEDGKFYALMRQ